MDELKELHDDLLNRWQDAFDRFAELDRATQSSEGLVYSNGHLFDLKNYTPQKFPAGGRMFPEQPESANSYYRYSLNAKGHPVRVAFGHTVNHFDCEGFYLCGDEEAEYVEFCLQTKVVSEYARMTLRDGIPKTYQKFGVNGRGSHIGGATGKNAIDRIIQCVYFRWVEIEQYEESGHRIVAGRGLSAPPGASPSLYSLEYSYSDTAKLERITRTREDGSKYTAFAVRSKVSMKELAAKLSERIAAHTIEALSKTNSPRPLQAVELSFRSVTNYVPGVIPAFEGDTVSDMSIVVTNGRMNWIGLNEEDFEPEMAQFLERMNTAENWNPGSRMLRQAAFMVTKLLPESIPAADGFLAFSIDWEFEGHELLTILKQCGATAATLRRLKKIGWLR